MSPEMAQQLEVGVEESSLSERLSDLELVLRQTEQSLDAPYTTAPHARSMLNRLMREVERVELAGDNPGQVDNFQERLTGITYRVAQMEVESPLEAAHNLLSLPSPKKESARVWLEIAIKKLAANQPTLTSDDVSSYENKLAEIERLTK